MIRSIASRKAIASIFTAAWSIFGAQSGYGQPSIEESKIYWTHPESGIHRSSLDGSNLEPLVIPDLRRPDKIALDIAGGKMYWTERAVEGIHRSDLDGSNLEILIEGYGPPGWNWITDIALDIDGGKMYWTQESSQGDYIEDFVARANLDGSNTEILFGQGAGDIALDLVRGKVYWTDGRLIGRADLDSLNSLNYLTTPRDEAFEYFYLRANPSDIALDVDGGKIYWTNAETIQRADLDSLYWTDLTAIQWDDPDSQNIEEVLTVSKGYPEELILLDADRGKIYWTNPGTQTIQRADLDGQNIEHFFDLGQLHLTESLAGFALDMDGGKMYWTDAGPERGLHCWMCWGLGPGTIQRADLDGQNREVLFDPIVRQPHSIALDRDKMYWTDVVKGTIHRADLNGQNREVLVTGLDEPRGITLTAGSKIYWTDSGRGKIQAANLDGSQIEDIVIGLGHPHTIALDRGKSKIYWGNDVYVMDVGSLTLIGSDLQRANLNGSQVEKIETVPPSWYEYIALDEDRAKIYWTSGSYVFRSDLDGTNIEEFSDLPYAWSFGAIALDSVGNKIYWTGLFDPPSSDWNSPSPTSVGIFRSNLDGSNVEEIPTAAAYNVEGYRSLYRYSRSAPTGIALYIPHPTFVSTPSTTPAIPTTSSLDPNFPNPFNANTQIAYHLATPGLVRLEIYNILGQPVRTLVNQFQPAGFYQVPWDARDQRGAPLAAGVYLTRLRHPDGAQTRRLLYLK